MRKLSGKFGVDTGAKRTILTEIEEENIVPRRIFPEDHEQLRRLAFKKNLSFVEVLKEIHEFAEQRLKKDKVSYYDRFEKYSSSYYNHKSARIPRDFNTYLNDLSTKQRSAKFLLSAMIQDYLKMHPEYKE